MIVICILATVATLGWTVAWFVGNASSPTGELIFGWWMVLVPWLAVMLMWVAWHRGW